MNTDTYYWAAGERVPLEASHDVLVDLASNTGLSKSDEDQIREHGRNVTASIFLLPEDHLPSSLRAPGAPPPGVHPVFHADDGALIAVLPEVRVESDDPKTLDKVKRLVAGGDDPADVTQPRPGRLVLKPTSLRGLDALRLANRLVEELRPDLAQARFLRVVDRPDHR